jgi:hypothetical protein
VHSFRALPELNTGGHLRSESHSGLLETSGCDLMQHRRKENEILATDQRNFYVISTREPFLEVHCRLEPGKSATGNDYSRRLHLPNMFNCFSE